MCNICFKYVNHMLNTRVFTYVKGIKNILFVSLLFFYTLGLMNILYILILNKKKIINTYTNQVQITFNFIQFHDKINLYFLSLFCISLSEQKTIKKYFCNSKFIAIIYGYWDKIESQKRHQY